MLEVEFSDYPNHPGETRTSTPDEFGMPLYKIDGERPRKLTLTGVWHGGKIDETERNRLSVWFFQKCIMGLNPKDKEVIIDADLPAELWQWYIAADNYNGDDHDRV